MKTKDGEIHTLNTSPNKDREKLTTKPQKNHEKISQYGAEDIVKQGHSDKTAVFSYMQFRDNHILAVECTNKTVLILLKNGTLITWGEQSNTLGRKINEFRADSFFPNDIRLTTKIVDIVCGKEHCLARGLNHKIYSWGSNSYGQLGLTHFAMNPNSDKDEPVEIIFFQNIKIQQIFARNYTSYALAEDKQIYGWGSNENGQLGVNYEQHKKISLPRVIDLNDKLLKDFTIFQNRKAKKIFVAEMDRPTKSLNQMLDMQKNKHLYFKEYELKDELEKLKIQQIQLKRRKANNTNDNEQLIKDINILIVKYKEKMNSLENKKKLINFEKNSENIKLFDKQIEFLQGKELEMKENIRKVEGSLDNDRIKTNNNNMSKTNMTPKDKNEERGDKVENETADKSTPLGDDKDSNRMVKVGDLIDRVNSELMIQKYNILNDHLKYQEEFKRKDRKKKKMNENILVLERLIEEVKEIIEKSLEKDSYKDYDIAMENVQQEIKNFNINKLTSIDKCNVDIISLLNNLNKTRENLEFLEEKISNFNVPKKNTMGKIITNIFTANVLTAKQNNILMEKIVDYSKSYYNNVFEQLIHSENPDNFNELKTKIDSFKNSNMGEENNDNHKDKHQDKDKENNIYNDFAFDDHKSDDDDYNY